MSKLNWKASSACLALAFIANAAHADQIWQVQGGTTSVRFEMGLLRDLGIKVDSIKETGTPVQDMEDPFGFGISGTSDLSFVSTGGFFREFAGGMIRNRGGFTLKGNKAVADLHDFALVPKGRLAWENLLIRSKQSAFSFDLNSARVFFDRSHKQLMIQGMDLIISPDFARAIKRPEIASMYVGMITVVADVRQTGGDAVDDYEAPPTGDGPQDVQLFAMSNLQSDGRTGTYPNGLNGLSMSTTSCNVGTDNINWYAPMDVRHPVIAFQMYRIVNDRFEQIGTSWLKHGFLATNSTSSGCAPCNSPGTGAKLGPGCSDTYGNGNNNDRNYLGERSEVNPFTGVWTCQGSWFSNYVNDCVRRNSGSSGLNSVAHRLEVLDANLGDPNAQYFYEAYYITPNDSNKYNNIGSRKVTPTWNGSTWSFSGQTDFIRGATIDRYGDVRSIAEPRTEGDAKIAVRMTFLGGGMYRYNYAIYNHDIDRQGREFSIPIDDSANVTAMGFRDIDVNAANDWTPVRGNGKITWSTATYESNPNANSLKYGTVYNFWIDCNIPPVDGMGSIGLYKPGVLPCQTFVTRTPGSVIMPLGFIVIEGDLYSGDHCSLLYDDANRLVVGSSNDQRAVVEFTSGAPATTPVMKFVLNAQVTRPGLSQLIEMYDYSQSKWVAVSGGLAPVEDTTTMATVATPANFIKVADREIKSRVTYAPINDEDPSQDGWTHEIDMARWKFQNF